MYYGHCELESGVFNILADSQCIVLIPVDKLLNYVGKARLLSQLSSFDSVELENIWENILSKKLILWKIILTEILVAWPITMAVQPDRTVYAGINIYKLLQNYWGWRKMSAKD